MGGDEIKSKIVVILDSDGILIDTHALVKRIIPKSWHSIEEEKPLLWDILRKMVILIIGDRVVDERLIGVDVEAIYEIKKRCDRTPIATKRPFWFGGKKRLMKQLETLYEAGMFRDEDIFSSCFSQDKGTVIREKIIHDQSNVCGIFVDDNENNLHGMPSNIRPVWFNPNGQMKVDYDGQCEVSELKQIPLLLDILYGRKCSA